MRTALLAALKRDNDGAVRALSPLAGRSLLGWQVDFVRSLKCQRIICLCEETGPEILALQREVEGEGAEFHLIRSSMQLVALLRTDDQLVMVLDSLMIETLDEDIIVTNGDRLTPQVYVFSATSDLEDSTVEEFERIDADRRWAGLAVLNSATVLKLADCPPDGEVMSLLLRLALQDGVACRALTDDIESGQQVAIASSQEALKSHENQLLGSAGASDHWAGMFDKFAQWAARSIVKTGSSIRVWAILAAAVLWGGIAAALLWFDYTTTGLFFAAAAALDSRVAIEISALRANLLRREKQPRYLRWVKPTIDVAAIVALIAALGPLNSGLERIALPAFAIGLARIAAREGGKIAHALWSDRTLHIIGFALAALAGFLAPALAVFGLGALAHKLLRDFRN